MRGYSYFAPDDVTPYLKMLEKLGHSVTGDQKYTGIHTPAGDAVSAFQQTYETANPGKKLGTHGELNVETQAALREEYAKANKGISYTELGNVPQILDKLGLDKETIKKINNYAKAHQEFAGKAAVDMGAVPQDKLNAALLAQSLDKANAAKADGYTVGHFGHQNTPKWLQDNWGNNGVNKANDKAPPRIAAASAAANAAQNMVMLANKIAETDPEAGKKLGHELAPALEAARHFANGMAGAEHIGTKEYAREMGQINDGLRLAAKEADAKGVPIQDAKGQSVKVEDYITQRSKEMQAGVHQHQERQPQLHTERATPSPAATPAAARQGAGKSV